MISGQKEQRGRQTVVKSASGGIRKLFAVGQQWCGDTRHVWERETHIFHLILAISEGEGGEHSSSRSSSRRNSVSVPGQMTEKPPFPGQKRNVAAKR